MYIHLWGSLIGEVALFIDAGGEELLLYKLHKVKRDISKALRAASLGETVPGGDSEPRWIFKFNYLNKIWNNTHTQYSRDY